MRKLIIIILFMSVSIVTFAQKIPANIIKKATAVIRIYCHRTEF